MAGMSPAGGVAQPRGCGHSPHRVPAALAGTCWELWCGGRREEGMLYHLRVASSACCIYYLQPSYIYKHSLLRSRWLLPIPNVCSKT